MGKKENKFVAQLQYSNNTVPREKPSWALIELPPDQFPTCPARLLNSGPVTGPRLRPAVTTEGIGLGHVWTAVIGQS